VVRIRAETTGSGTISGNRYGLYIADQGVGTTGGTIYNLYSAGASRLHHLEGDLTWGGAAWATWSPTWTNLTVGNGTVVAKFKQFGKTVICRLSIVFGSTTSVSGLITFSLPVTSASYGGGAGLTVLGSARLSDASVPVSREGHVINLSTTTGAVTAIDSSVAFLTGVATSGTVPFTWTTGDAIGCQFIYEAA
jgi:hypothetical protein